MKNLTFLGFLNYFDKWKFFIDKTLTGYNLWGNVR